MVLRLRRAPFPSVYLRGCVTEDVPALRGDTPTGDAPGREVSLLSGTGTVPAWARADGAPLGLRCPHRLASSTHTTLGVVGRMGSQGTSGHGLLCQKEGFWVHPSASEALRPQTGPATRVSRCRRHPPSPQTSWGASLRLNTSHGHCKTTRSINEESCAGAGWTVFGRPVILM